LLHFDPDQSLEHTPSEAPNQTFVFDGVSGVITEQNDKGDEGNDGDGKKKIKYYVDVTVTTIYSYPQAQGKSQDPRNDPKYDSIDWQDDNPDKNLTIEEMDEILEEQQSEGQENSGNDVQQEQNTSNNGSDDGGESTDETANEENDDESDSNDDEEENN